MKTHHRARLFTLIATVSVVAMVLGSFAHADDDMRPPTVRNNFYEVDQGKLFRSAQLNGRELEEAIKTNGIKTVINLRGHNPDQAWYKDEVAATERTGAQLINISMSSDTLPSRDNLNKLLESYKNAPRPILVHCQAGADRTGEAVAIYSMIYMNKSKAQALDMLSFKYMHIAMKKPAKTYFIREVWQGADWAGAQYQPCTGEYKYYKTTNSECTKQ